MQETAAADLATTTSAIADLRTDMDDKDAALNLNITSNAARCKRAITASAAIAAA